MFFFEDYLAVCGWLEDAFEELDLNGKAGGSFGSSSRGTSLRCLEWLPPKMDRPEPRKKKDLGRLHPFV